MQSNAFPQMPPSVRPGLARQWCAIDPGHKSSAMAYSLDGRTLSGCKMVDTPQHAVGGFSTWSLVIERPEIRDGQTKNPDSVLKVRDAAMRWEMLVQWERVRPVRPSEWKGGSQKKPPNHKRILKALTPNELRIIEAAIGLPLDDIRSKVEAACIRLAATRKVSKYAWQAHNLLDAVGILLFALGRL